MTVQAGGEMSGEVILIRRYDLDVDSLGLVTGLNSKLTSSGTLNLGGASLAINNQATVQTLDFFISSGLNEAKFTQGVAVVSDSAKLIVTDNFSIGGTLIPGDGTVIPGKGTLNVIEAGQLTSGSASIAGNDGTVGLVEIDGFGSTWENFGDLNVGRNGYGKLVVSNGGQFTGSSASSFATSIGNGIPSQGEVEITDPGSSWQILSPLYVGHLGKGSLTVQNGASASTESAVIGHFVVARGEVLVTGANSTWTNSGELSVGGDPNAFGGTGELEIADGGLVNVGATATVWKTSELHLDDGTLQATSINIAGGSLSGVGTLIGNLTNTGEISPGNSPGTLQVQGDFTQSLGGFLRLEIGSTAADLLQVTGNAKLGGTLQLSLLGGFSPVDDMTYDLLTASKLSGAFDTLLLPDLGPGRSWQFNYGADRVSITAVPEPATMVLAALGGGGLRGGGEAR